MLEGTITTKETGLHASFDGIEQSYVLCTIARIHNPDITSQARIIGMADIPQGIGDTISLSVLRVVTDRKAGIVRFDCTLNNP